jgi:hypothetical protein
MKRYISSLSIYSLTVVAALAASCWIYTIETECFGGGSESPCYAPCPVCTANVLGITTDNGTRDVCIEASYYRNAGLTCYSNEFYYCVYKCHIQHWLSCGDPSIATFTMEGDPVTGLGYHNDEFLEQPACVYP